MLTGDPCADPNLLTRSQIIILLVLLYQQLGVSAIVGAFVSIAFLTPLQFVVVIFLQKNKKGLLVSRTDWATFTAALDRRSTVILLLSTVIC